MRMKRKDKVGKKGNNLKGKERLGRKYREKIIIKGR